ncbi:mannitol dehydrogenase family protein [Prosthecomicrobium sp. N25]|uniref:mannitol dehydrogenase family protein n=1 Tax=Prosthecomicrobium sp. N25 TaxID=3129254 RepID=UPI00307863FD
MRLGPDLLDRLPAAVARPRYDREAVGCGVVHLGIGAFHRAHQAVYFDDVLAGGETEWGIAAASLRSPDTRDALEPQNGLYTLAVRAGDGEALRVIGSVQQVLVAPEDPERLIALLADPRIRIVTLTITEKGYCHDPATGALKEDHPDVVHDLGDLFRPRSALGFLAAALAGRFAAGTPPFTIVSCDNLPANGKTLKAVLDRFCALVSDELGQWVRDEVCCPSSMVDRIVPATTDEDRARVSAALGVTDAWPVMTEPFTQWVLEDRFPNGRPDLAAVGVELVDDVEPFEHMKLRLLNGSHSTLAYLGYLGGYQTVSETMADPAYARLVRGLMDEEATPTLHMPPGTDLTAYKDALIERFRNPALKHRTWQIAMDGSQKLPQRLLGTIRDRLAAGASIDRLALGVAAWMRYVTGVDEKGEPIDVRDPMASRFKDIAAAAGNPETLAASLIGIREIFGDDLPAEPRFIRPVKEALASLYRVGARATVAETAGR